MHEIIQTEAPYLFIVKRPDCTEIEGRFSARTYEEDGVVYAECLELRLVDYGSKPWEAIENLRNMIIVTIMDALETNTLDDMMLELGFKREAKSIPTLEVYNAEPIPTKGLTPLLVEATRETSRTILSGA